LRQVVQAAHVDHDYDAAVAAASASLAQSGWHVDYISVRSADTLLPPVTAERELVVLGAARLGSTRLIDNIEFEAG
jgi:pantoate--beta-alanine ligase